MIKQVSRYSDSEAIFTSLHAPYWDYIGWKDRFTKPEIDARQRLLARLNRTNVCTPQVFSGMDARLRGGGGRYVSRQLEQIGSQEAAIKLGITKVSDGKYELVWGNAPDLPLQGYVVITSDGEIGNVLVAGENTHVKLEHANLARWWTSTLTVSKPDGHFIINTLSFDKDFSQGKIVFDVSNTTRHILQAFALNKDCSHNND